MCLGIILEAEFSLKLAFRLKLPDNREPGFFYKGKELFCVFFLQELVAAGKGRSNVNVALL